MLNPLYLFLKIPGKMVVRHLVGLGPFLLVLLGSQAALSFNSSAITPIDHWACIDRGGEAGEQAGLKFQWQDTRVNLIRVLFKVV